MTLYTVGPTPPAPEVLRAMGEPMPYHRSDAFRALLGRCLEGLQEVFRTTGEVHILTSSGTGAMEAAVTNLFSGGEKILTVNGGKFGERWGSIGRSHGLDVVEAHVPWGDVLDPSGAARLLGEHPDVRGVFLTHCETSTGALTDVEGVAAAIRRTSDALIVVDAISSLGAHQLEMEKWGLDCVIGGSQKSLRLPPGLAFIALSGRGAERSEEEGLPRYYFDLRRSREALRQGDTPWTPAITLVQGLTAALDAFREADPAELRESFRMCAAIFRAGISATGFGIFGSRPADSMTAALLPDGLRASDFRRVLLEKHGIIVSGGQGKLTDLIVRVSHMGFRDFQSNIELLQAFEDTLLELDYPVHRGSAVAAARNRRETGSGSI